MAIEIDRLRQLLVGAIPGLTGALDLQPVAGGQSNPTFFANFDNRRLVVRKKPDGTILQSAHAVDREYKVLEALAGTDVAVPSVLLFHEEPDIMGTPFYVMERVEGRIFHDSALGEAPRSDRSEMYRSMACMLAILHKVDFDCIGLSSFGKQTPFFPRQLARWTSQWQSSASSQMPEMAQISKWLSSNLPVERGPTIIHGDFRVGNLIFHPTEPRVVAVLDWELSTLGHPMADLAHTCLYSWYLASEEYRGILDVDLTESGLPDMREFISCYYDAADSSDRLEKFHLVFAMFRNAVIFQGIADRAIAGNAAAADAERVGRLAPVMVRRALTLIESGDPLQPFKL